MSRFFLIIILLLSANASVSAQVTGFDFPTMRWSPAHGLKSISVNDLDMDSRDVIWVGTVEGLYRHQGNYFTNINTLVENSPFDNPIEIFDLYIDKDDRIWIGTVENGLLMYDIRRNVITHFDHLINGTDYLSNLRIYGLHMFNDSIFRFNSHTHGLIDYNLNQDSFKLIEVFTDSVALEKYKGFQLMMEPLKAPNSGIVKDWYASLCGMVRYDSVQDSFIYYDDGDQIRIRSAIMDTDSVAWCVTYGQGLYSFDLKQKKFTNYRCQSGEDWIHPCLSGASIQLYNDSTLILDSDDMIYTFNKNSKTFTRFNDLIPSSSWSGRTMEMHWINDELWQASWSSTLYRHFQDDHGVQSVSAKSEINDIYYDRFHDRYISTSFPDLITFHEKDSHEEIRVHKSIEDDSYVEGVTVDLKGNVWILTREAILKYNEKTKKYSQPFKELLEPIRLLITFRKIGTHPNGDIWTVSHDGTILVFDPETLEHKFYGAALKESIPLEYSYRAHLEQFTEDGYTWFSSQEGFFGLSPNDKNHIFCKKLKDRKTNKLITIISPSIGIGSDDKVCFGSKTHEIYIVNKDSLDGGYADLIPLKPLIPNLSVNDIEIDKEGVIWITTKMGLIKVDQKNDRIDLFGDANRLGNLGELELIDGNIPVALTKNHFRIINPNNLRPFQGKPNIQLLSTEVDTRDVKNPNGKTLLTGQKIKLGPNDNFLRIQFNDFNYTSQQPKSYAIKIDGLHKDWIDLKDRSEFGISGLPGGISSIMVKSKLQFAKEFSDPVNILSIDVTPPIMQRKWFWALCAGLLLLLFYLGYRYRLSQLKEKQNLMIAFNKQLAETEMKALRAQMNPHFLFNVLNAIKLNVQKNEQENAIDFITDFSKLIRSVLQNSGKQRISLAEELQTLELYIKIERKRFSTSFDYEFTLDESINTEQITIPPMLIQPYVENAIWHGILHRTEGKGQININTYKSENSIVVEIVDNGIGREKANKLKLKSAQKNKSMGMQITKDRMAMSNIISSDQIKVNIIDLYNDDGQAAGTKVIIELQQSS